MTAPLASEVLREFGASVRRFRSARHALLWYRDQLAQRLQATRQGFELGSGPRSRVARDEAQATFAAIAQCLRPTHESDPLDPDERDAVRWRVSGEMQCWLLSWYEGDEWGDGTDMASRAGLSRWAFQRRCKRTERVLRVRLEAAGLPVGEGA